MTRRHMERLAELLLRLYEDNGDVPARVRDAISTVRAHILDRLEAGGRS